MATTSLRANATALITGGASGVGFATAKLCRQKFGMHIVLIDRDSTSLQKAVEALDDSNESLRIEAFDMDVSNTNAWTHVAKAVKETFGEVDFLMLNAGTSLKAQGEDNDRLKTWKDLDYWNKVSFWLILLFIYPWSILAFPTPPPLITQHIDEW